MNLEDTLDTYYAPIKLPEVNREGLKAAIYKDLLELVGADEVPLHQPFSSAIASEGDKITRNELRAELRNKLKGYCGIVE